MHYRNSQFQVKYFIVGACHTADEMYRKLQELREERDVALKNVEASVLREKAKILRAETVINDLSKTEADKLEAQADILELKAFKDQSQACLEEAIRERDYIDTLIAQVQPFRKYAHLPDHESHQLAQQEDWKLELAFRAENCIASIGYIPTDQLATMRQHPEWSTFLLPKIQGLIQLTSQSGGDSKILTQKGMSFLLESPQKIDDTV